MSERSSKAPLLDHNHGHKVDTIGLPEYSVRNRPRLGPERLPGAPVVAEGANASKGIGSTVSDPFPFGGFGRNHKGGSTKIGTGGR